MQKDIRQELLNQREQIQEDIITILDGVIPPFGTNDEFVTKACQAVVDGFAKLVDPGSYLIPETYIAGDDEELIPDADELLHWRLSRWSDDLEGKMEDEGR